MPISPLHNGIPQGKLLNNIYTFLPKRIDSAALVPRARINIHDYVQIHDCCELRISRIRLESPRAGSQTRQFACIRHVAQKRRRRDEQSALDMGQCAASQGGMCATKSVKKVTATEARRCSMIEAERVIGREGSRDDDKEEEKRNVKEERQERGTLFRLVVAIDKHN